MARIPAAPNWRGLYTTETTNHQLQALLRARCAASRPTPPGSGEANRNQTVCVKHPPRMQRLWLTSSSHTPVCCTSPRAEPTCNEPTETSTEPQRLANYQASNLFGPRRFIGRIIGAQASRKLFLWQRRIGTNHMWATTRQRPT